MDIVIFCSLYNLYYRLIAKINPKLNKNRYMSIENMYLELKTFDKKHYKETIKKG